MQLMISASCLVLDHTGRVWRNAAAGSFELRLVSVNTADAVVDSPTRLQSCRRHDEPSPKQPPSPRVIRSSVELR